MGCTNSNQVISNQFHSMKTQIKFLGDRLIEHLSQDNLKKTSMKSINLSQSLIVQQQNQKKNSQDKFKNETIYQQFIKKIKSQQITIFKKIPESNEKCKKEKVEDQKDKQTQDLALSEDIKDIIKNYYQILIGQKLQALNQSKLLSTEFKNHLSWNIANLNLTIMHKIVKQPSFKYTGNNFKSLEEFQKQFLGFLKKKYPRGDNLDAGQLSNEFKELIDFTDEYEHDILTRTGFYFDSEDGFQIMKKIKLFINKLIDQTSKHYKTFQDLMKEQVFSTADKDSFVVGRKIPQNVSKYKRIDKNSLEIHSNEIFRIMVKWIEDLQETVKNPSQKISSNSQWCFIKRQENKKPQLIKCAKYYRQMFIQQGLYQKIKQFNKFNKSNKQNKKENEIQKFNISIINCFEKIQQYSPLHLSRQQAQIIKFSEYNMKFHKQSIQQKLISLIKILVKSASQINNIIYGSEIKPYKSTQIALNLVKFRIFDLLRCKFQGNKEQIIKIKKKFQTLQSQNKIKIIKIKNRFNTDLSDAMIIFKILKRNRPQNQSHKENQSRKKEQELSKSTQLNSFLKQQDQKDIQKKQNQEQCHLICQCQLILTQKSKSSNKKLHNIQTLNHYLYELERSPFKVLGQSILQLNYKYDIIKYTNKIKMIQSTKYLNFCQHQNTIQVKQLQVKQQNFSFVCGKCWVFYQPLQNNQKIKTCAKCFRNLCYKCHLQQKAQIQSQNKFNLEIIDRLKQENKKLNLKEIQKHIKQRYLEYLTIMFFNRQYLLKENIEFKQNQRIKKLQQFRNTQEMRWMKRKAKQCLDLNFYQPKQNLNKCFGSKNQIKVKQLILFLYREYHQMDYQGTIERIFFMIMSYSKNRVILRGYKYEAYDQRLVNVQNKQQYYQGHQIFQLNENDVLYYPKAYQKQCRSIANYEKIYLFKQLKQLILDGQKLITYCSFDMNSFMQNQNPYVSIVYDMFIKKATQIQQEEFQKFLMRKRLVYMSKHLTDQLLIKLKTIFYEKKLSNAKKHFKQLKLINLQNNQIKNTQKLLKDCKQLQILILKNNIIEKIEFNNSLDSLQILQLHNNRINVIQGLQYLKCLKILNLQNNLLQVIFKVKNNEFIEGKQSELNNQTIFPFLKSLNVSKNKLKLIFKIHSTKLETINLFDNQLEEISGFLSSSWQNLKYLDLRKNKLTKLGKISGQKLMIQRIDLSDNQLEDISEFLSCPWQNLKFLYLQGNKIRKIGIIPGQKLKIQIINLSKNQLEDISEFLTSSWQNLKSLDLKQNKINKIGKMKGQKLKIQTIDLSANQLEDISEFLTSSWQNLKSLYLENNRISTIKRIEGQKVIIQTINLSANQLQEISGFLSSSWQNLKYLDLRKNKLTKIGKISGQKLMIQRIDLSDNQLEDISEFLSSPWQNLKWLNLYYNNIRKIRIIQGIKLKIQTIHLQENQLEDISEFLSSRWQNLQSLYLQDNKIHRIGKITGQKLKIYKIDLSDNNLQDISEFLSSSWENLKHLYLPNNRLSKIGRMGGQKLNIQKIDFSDNQLQDVSEFLSSSWQNLKFLNLKKNKLRKIGRIKGQKSRIQIIDISQNQLQEIDELLSISLQIKQIYLDNNKIKSLGKITAQRSDIQMISLNNNQIQNISDFLSSSFHNLKRLSLRNNQISKIKLTNKQLSNLQEIDLNANNLVQIPDLNAPNLQHLSLGQNDIKKLTSQQIGKFKYLKGFSLSSNNQLSKIPIFNHPTLQQFFLTQNNLQNIQDFFKSNFPKIKRINLSQSTYLTQLPNIDSFTQLQQLNLSQCPIVLDNSFKLIQKQNSRYSNLNFFYISIKTSSKQQFNCQKQKIQKILQSKIQVLQIFRFNQKIPFDQQYQHQQEQQEQQEYQQNQQQEQQKQQFYSPNILNNKNALVKQTEPQIQKSFQFLLEKTLQN